MNWPSLDESVYESVYLHVFVYCHACNQEIQHLIYFIFKLAIRCEKKKRLRAVNLTVPLGSGQTISGMGRVRASV